MYKNKIKTYIKKIESLITKKDQKSAIELLKKVDPKLQASKNKKIYIVGMPTCARSPKENGADWVLQRVISGLKISQKVINKMSIGGLIK